MAERTGDTVYQGWSEFLDGLQRQLEAQREVLDDPEALLQLPQQRWNTPPGLGPLPAALADRARDLHGQLASVAGQLEHRRAGTAAQLRAVAAVPRTDNGTPVYLDSLG